MPKQLVIGGLSGSGKTSAAALLIEVGIVRRGVTCATRAPRPGEVDGVDYDFLSPEEFTTIRANGGLAEETEYVGNATPYGILWNRINEAKAASLPTVWILDHRGLQQMQKLFPGEVTCVFLWGFWAELNSRMTRRRDSETSVEQRLAHYAEELALGVKYYQPNVINTTCLPVQQVAERIRAILEA